MPEANKIKKEEPMVDIDTSGPETEVNLPEENINQVPTEKVPTEEGSTNEETTTDTAKPEDAPAEPSEQPDVQTSETKED